MRRLSQEHVSLIATRARALAEPARVRILFQRLSRGDQAVGQLAAALGMQQSTASKHLQVLFRAGLGRPPSVGERRHLLDCRGRTDRLVEYLAHRQLAGSTAHEDAVPCMNFSRAAGSFRAAHRREPLYWREAR